MGKPATVDEYYAGLGGAQAPHLQELRALSRAAVPTATEQLRWGYPAIVHETGTILFMLSAHKAFASIAFTPSTREAFDAELADYETGKGTVKLPYDKPVPADLLRRMIEFRVDEHENRGVGWM